MKLFATFCLLVVSTAGIDIVQANDCSKPACCDQQPCQSSCKLLTCRAEVKTIKVSKTQFDVECDHTCIPAITFPWQKKKKSSCGSCSSCLSGGCESECLAPKCGKVISVNVLKKDKYDVEKCVCEWNIEEVPCVVSCCKPSCCHEASPSGPIIVPETPKKREVAPPPPISTRRPPLFDYR